MRYFVLFFLLVNLLSTNRLTAQDGDESWPLKDLEMEIKSIAWDVLNHDSLEFKIEQNNLLMRRLATILKRPDSYDYPFDSLKTISILSPEDGSFRIFTWQLVDKPKNEYYGTLGHYYYGLIQRKYVRQDGEIEYLVIPLLELEAIPKGFENIITDNLQWLGALYYKPKHLDHIMTVKSNNFKIVPKSEHELKKDQRNAKDTEVVTFVPNRYRSRMKKTTDALLIETHKRVKEKVNYYVLMGWNGWDKTANYKMVEIMSFDPEDSLRVIFGAPIFYFDKQIPKCRGLFKYSEYAPFSLNTNYVSTSKGGRKKMMIVYDHLAMPNKSNSNEEILEAGPEGTYDALQYSKRYKAFKWYRDVSLKDDYNKQYKPKQLQKQIERQKKETLLRLEKMGMKLEMEVPDSDKKKKKK